MHTYKVVLHHYQSLDLEQIVLEVVIEIIPLDFQLQVPFGLAIRTHQVVDINKKILHCWTSYPLMQMTIFLGRDH